MTLILNFITYCIIASVVAIWAITGLEKEIKLIFYIYYSVLAITIYVIASILMFIINLICR